MRFGLACLALLLLGYVRGVGDEAAGRDLWQRFQHALDEAARGFLWQAEQLAQQSPRFPVSAREEFAVLLIESHIRQGLWQTGWEEAQRFLLREPFSPLRGVVWRWAGIAAFELRRFADAERCWDSALASLQSRTAGAPTEVEVTIGYWRILALLQQGHYQRAEGAIEAYVQRYPASPYADDALFFQALLFELQGKYRQAAEQLQQLRQLYPCRSATAQALARQAYVRLILQEFAQALRLTEELEILLERFHRGDTLGIGCEPPGLLDIPRQELLFVRAEAYREREQWEAAQRAYDELLSQFPEGPLAERARLQRAWVTLRQGRAEEALRRFQALRGSSDREIAALAALYGALARKMLGDTANARQELLELSLQPNFPATAEVLLELGQLSYEAGQYRNARLNLEQAMRETGKTHTMLRVLLLLGATYQQLGQWENALRSFRMAGELLQRGDTLLIPRWRRYREQALLGEGIALVFLQRPAEAVDVLQRAVAEHLENALQGDELLFWLAEASYASGDFSRATETYEQLLLRYPKSSRREEALYGTAWCAFRTQQMERAVFWFERLLKEFPQTRYAVEALLRKADALYLLRQLRDAAAAYWELAERFPQTTEAEYAAYQYGYVLYRLRDFAAAEQAFRYFIRTYPRSSLADEALYFLGWLSFQQQRYEEAVERFRKLLEAYPNSSLAARTWFAIGNAYYNAERWQDALEAYRTVVERYPNSPYAVEAVKSVQYCLLALGQTEEAYRWADTIAARYPATRLEEESRLKRAELLFSHQRYDAAFREFAEFARRYPYSERTPEALYWAFRSALALADVQEARRISEQLRGQYPQQWYSVQSLLELARFESRLDLRRADSLYHEVERLGDSLQAAEAVFQRGVLAYVRQDTLQALRTWAELLRRFPSTEFADQARYQLAMYWRARQQYDSVRLYLAPVALRSDERGAEARYYIGEAWMREGRCDSAVIAFRALQTTHPGTENWYSLSLLHMGECYENMGEVAAAIEAYRLLLALRPDDEYGRTARSRLSRLQRGGP